MDEGYDVALRNWFRDLPLEEKGVLIELVKDYIAHSNSSNDDEHRGNGK